MAYLTLAKSLSRKVVGFDSQSPIEIMKDFFSATEGILMKKKSLFCPQLRDKCVEFLTETYREVNPTATANVLSASVSSQEKEFSKVIEWCTSQGWCTINQSKRGRNSKGSRAVPSPQPPSSDSTTPPVSALPSSNSEQHSSENNSQPRKRQRSDGGSFAPQALNEGDENLTKKKRALARVKQLLQEFTTPSPVITSTSTTLPTRALISTAPPFRPPLPAVLPRKPLTPPTTIGRKIAFGKARPPIAATPSFRVPDHIIKAHPAVQAKVLASPVNRGGVKEKKRRAILKLRQIYYTERVTGKVQRSLQEQQEADAAEEEVDEEELNEE